MFPKRLKLARQASGLSIRKLGELCGVSGQAIHKYEMGATYPRSTVLVSLSRALGVSIDFLMGNTVAGVTFDHWHMDAWDKIG
jgi:transcriptional regulator with XRE-family HTH domain